MYGRTIELTKEAMMLFMQSLPTGAKFDIVSFGSSYSCMTNNLLKGPMDYNDKNLKYSKN